MKGRLDQALVKRGLVATRSQAESYLKLGQVRVNGAEIRKSGYLVSPTDKLSVLAAEQYVSRAALKLASVAEDLHIDFKDKFVLDVGSSTGGFTQYALSRGAKKVIAVDVGSNQLHPSLRSDDRIELHEQTDIREFVYEGPIDLVLADVSFISLRLILPAVKRLSSAKTLVVAMVKPQFEVADGGQKNKGVIKNERIRRDILKDFESWAQKLFKIINKADSHITGEKGNRERFYILKPL